MGGLSINPGAEVSSGSVNIDDPDIIMAASPLPSLPSAMICLFPGCIHPVFVERPAEPASEGRVHQFCSRSHAQLFITWRHASPPQVDGHRGVRVQAHWRSVGARRTAARMDNVRALHASKPTPRVPSEDWGMMPGQPPDETLDLRGELYRPTTDSMQRSWPTCGLPGCHYPVRMAPLTGPGSCFTDFCCGEHRELYARHPETREELQAMNEPLLRNLPSPLTDPDFRSGSGRVCVRPGCVRFVFPPNPHPRNPAWYNYCCERCTAEAAEEQVGGPVGIPFSTELQVTGVWYQHLLEEAQASARLVYPPSVTGVPTAPELQGDDCIEDFSGEDDDDLHTSVASLAAGSPSKRFLDVQV